MNRSTMIFTLISALLIGGVVGLSFNSDNQPQTEGIEAEPRLVSSNNVSLDFRFIDPNDFVVEEDDFGVSLPSTLGENFIDSDKVFKHETLLVELPLDGAVEYKVEMEQSDSIVFQWAVVEGEVYSDFHGHPKDDETGFFTRYLESEGIQSSGSIVAPYKGQHGWFWLNIADHPITIELVVAGFYDQIVMLPLEY